MKNMTIPVSQSRTLMCRWGAIAMLIVLLTTGCSQPDPNAADSTDTEAGQPPTGPAPMYANDGPAEPIATEGNGLPGGDRELETNRHFAAGDSQPSPSDLPTIAAAPTSPDPLNPVPSGSTSNELADSEPIAIERPAAPKLPGDMSAQELVRFLATADEDMQLIHGNRAGIEDPREARDTLMQIVDLKLQASRQLSAHPEATEAQRSEGNRGELQSLSHLAALSDLRAAKELQTLAESNISSGDSKLVADSRLVLIGFAIESLQNGDQSAAEKLADYSDQIASSDSAADIPALIAMGQARQVLQTYGHPELARQIRDTIIKTFAGSKNPDVAKMAAQFAGNVRFDEVDKLREQILSDQSVTMEQWISSVETLIHESSDIQTVGYLAGASVDFESSKKIKFAEATLKTMASHFREPDAATTREVQTAIAAMTARQSIIGQMFDPDLPSVSESPLSLKPYRGKVVLIPFWGTGIPLSVQPIPILQSIRDANADKVAIVGVNLDSEEAAVQTFAKENGIDFPSFRLVPEQRSEIASRFGMVSMPFVAILNAEGKVAAIQLSDFGLQENIDRLIAAP